MKKTLDVIYENGLLRPLKKLSLPEGQKIRVTLESHQDKATPESSTNKKAASDPANLPKKGNNKLPYLRVREALKACQGAFIEDISLDRVDRI